MNYDNLAIKGDVTADGYLGWIELSSFQWGVGRGISSPTMGSADRESSAPSVSEINVTKSSDVATPRLLSEALEGEGKTVVIAFTKTDKGKIEAYMTYVLANTIISGYSVSSGGDRPMESLSLNFTKIQFRMPSTAEKQGAVTYDLATAKVS
jgi:type VI secretion system secreted protein Hcp